MRANPALRANKCGFTIVETLLLITLACALFSLAATWLEVSGRRPLDHACARELKLVARVAQEYLRTANGGQIGTFNNPRELSTHAISAGLNGLTQNSYGQSYQIFFYREDAGAGAMAPKSSLSKGTALPRMVIWIVTIDGAQIPARSWLRIAPLLGAQGGYVAQDGTINWWQQVNKSSQALFPPGKLPLTAGHLVLRLSIQPQQLQSSDFLLRRKKIAGQPQLNRMEKVLAVYLGNNATNPGTTPKITLSTTGAVRAMLDKDALLFQSGTSATNHSKAGSASASLEKNRRCLLSQGTNSLLFTQYQLIMEGKEWYKNLLSGMDASSSGVVNKSSKKIEERVVVAYPADLHNSGIGLPYLKVGVGVKVDKLANYICEYGLPSSNKNQQSWQKGVGRMFILQGTGLSKGVVYICGKKYLNGNYISHPFPMFPPRLTGGPSSRPDSVMNNNNFLSNFNKSHNNGLPPKSKTRIPRFGRKDKVLSINGLPPKSKTRIPRFGRKDKVLSIHSSSPGGPSIMPTKPGSALESDPDLQPILELDNSAPSHDEKPSVTGGEEDSSQVDDIFSLDEAAEWFRDPDVDDEQGSK